MKRLSLYIAFSLLSLCITAKTMHVGKSFPVKSIKQAVHQAKPFDTLYIEKGIYAEGNIEISKSLSLIGEKETILDGRHKHEILTLSGKNFIIKGITFRNSGYSSMNDYASVKLIDASDFTIENNTIENTHFAIHVSNSNHFQISNNIIKGTPGEEQSTGNGIHLWKCNHATIENNSVVGHRDGIYFEFVTQSIVQNNKSEKNIRYGLHFMFSNDDRYLGNNFSENGAGVAVMFSHDIQMIKNTFQKNRGASSYGLLLKEISDGEISQNSFLDNTAGIYMEGTNRIKIINNKLSGNGFALRIQASCSDNTVEQNNFMSNTFDVATNGSLVLNKFANNYWDKYEGYDLNKDGKGDVPFHPLSLYSVVMEQNPVAAVLLRSFMVNLLDKVENAIPSMTPETFRDDSPAMKPYAL